MKPEHLPLPPSAPEPLERLTLGEVRGSPEHRLPFLFEPGVRLTPVVMSFPHVGLAWPSELGRRPHADFARHADLAVHRLFRFARAHGVASVTSVYSRLVVDLNRAEDDVSPAWVLDHPHPAPRLRPGDLPPATRLGPLRHHRGVVWSHTEDGQPLFERPLAYRDFERRIRLFHRPYVEALTRLLERRRARFGYAILLDIHSMPDLADHDIVLGTLDRTSCARGLVERVAATLSDPGVPRVRSSDLHDLDEEGKVPRRVGFRTALDRPYRGGALARRFGSPEQGWHALQIELGRSLYLEGLGQGASAVPPAGTKPPARTPHEPPPEGLGTSRWAGTTRPLRFSAERAERLTPALEALLQAILSFVPLAS